MISQVTNIKQNNKMDTLKYIKEAHEHKKGKVCSKCNEHKLKKLVTAAGFKLKGTGWYETDFKTKAKKTPEKKN